MTDARKVLKNEDIEKVSGGGFAPWEKKPVDPFNPFDHIIFKNDFPKDPANETLLEYMKRKIKENREA